MPEVTCINKSDRYNPWERITHLGGPNPDGKRWRLSQAEVIAAIEQNTYGEFYVDRPQGDRVKVIIATSQHGNKYVKTTADGDQPNNLLSLPECPR
jgi:hypothetical protein